MSVRHAIGLRLCSISIATGLLAGVSTIQAANADALSPSGMAVQAPSPNGAFPDYVKNTRNQIRTVLESTRFADEKQPFGSFGLDEVVEIRAPYDIAPDRNSCADGDVTLSRGENLGFVMVHGLTDSPYWLSDVRDVLRDKYPCASFHGVLLPGHGTVPADLMDVAYQDWMDTVKFGVESFGPEVEQIIPIGFSTGAALIGRYYDMADHDDRLNALVMLSPGFSARSGMAWLTPYVRYVKNWAGKGENNDPGKYGSMAMNGAAEFHLLTSPYRDGSIGTVDIPVFVAVSSDDQTIDPLVVLDFFCEKVTVPNRHMVWYQGEIEIPDEQTQCDGIDVVKSANADFRTLNHAHTGITLSPNDPVYGLDGKHPDCGHYDNKEDKETCQTAPDAVYGERNLVDGATPGTLRRVTFNPDFDTMMEKIMHFIAVSRAPATPNPVE
ncbi:alpha/beta hydrolase [Thalassospira lucentensis]|uniref:alpha/beta hydrolase n=1 Tax=Thalassospira lucentensis TaxID=168935 RepID=UPI00399D650E